jgi:KRAB domain-containing zinc finger protein
MSLFAVSVNICISGQEEKTPLIDEPFFSCTQCAKSIAQSFHLQIHVRGVHTGEKPYSCSLCSKSFAQRDKLQAHVRIHSGEKSHSCLQCT